MLYARVVLESLDLPFVQRGLAEVALLSVGAGLIGTWIVLRGLAFHSHAVGTAAFPGLVLADGLGFAAALGALGAAAVFAGLVALISRGRSDDRGSEVALVLVGMLALGVILASDVFESSAGLETLLFGSLFLIDGGDLAFAAAVSALAMLATLVAGRHWIAHGFDGEGERTDPARSSLLEPALLGLVALVTAAALSAVGALLVAALFVVPAATTRLWSTRMRTWQLATIALCAFEGTAGVLISVEFNAPPGATIAVVSGSVFALAAMAAALRRGGRKGGSLARWAMAGALVLTITGCGTSESGAGAAIVATTPIAGDLATRVAGDDLEVATLLAPSTDPHEYEPRPDDIEALAGADLVIASGGDLDQWIADAIEDSGSDAELLVLADEIPHEIDADPHWWHDPRNAVAAVTAIAAATADLGADAASVEQRGGELAAEVEATDKAIERCVDSVPAADRKLVTDHDAFGYLAERYGIEIVGAVIPATTTEAQPSAGELAELRETIESEGVSAVFPEASVSTDLARAVARETGASAEYELYGDTLGPEGSSGDTYLGMLRANADALVRGFTAGARGCDA